MYAIIRTFPPFLVDLIRQTGWLVILTIIFVPLERLFAIHPSKVWRSGIGADLGYFFLNTILASTLLGLPLGAVAFAAHYLVPYSIQSALNEASFWTRALAGLLAGEIGYYWGHRLMHTVPVLWRFHSIHHSPERLDFLVNSRAHPIDLVIGRLFAFAPLVILNLGTPAGSAGPLLPIVVGLGGTVWPFLIHANIRWRFGPLEWLIATPRFHHWHHAMDPANQNYASMLPVIDFIFGTLHMPQRLWPALYGIHEAMPISWAGQLIQPLSSETFPPASVSKNV